MQVVAVMTRASSITAAIRIAKRDHRNPGRNRVFIDAIRDIKAGEELGYDYQLTWETTDDPAELALV